MPFNFTTFSSELNTTSNTNPLWLLHVQLEKLQDKLKVATKRAEERQTEAANRYIRSKGRNNPSDVNKNSWGKWKEYFQDSAVSMGSTVASSVDYNIDALEKKIAALNKMIQALHTAEDLNLAKFNQIFAENYSSDLSLSTKLGGLRWFELTPTEDLLNQLRILVNQMATDSKESKNDLFVTIMHRLAERERALEKKIPQTTEIKTEEAEADANVETSRSSISQAIIPYIKNPQVDAPKKLSLFEDLMARIKKVAVESAEKNVLINPMIFYVEIVRWEGEQKTGWSKTNQMMLKERRIASVSFLPPPKSAGMLDALKKELLDQVVENKEKDFGLTEVQSIRAEALQGHDRELQALITYCSPLIRNSNEITTENPIKLDPVIKNSV